MRPPLGPPALETLAAALFLMVQSAIAALLLRQAMPPPWPVAVHCVMMQRVMVGLLSMQAMPPPQWSGQSPLARPRVIVKPSRTVSCCSPDWKRKARRSRSRFGGAAHGRREYYARGSPASGITQAPREPMGDPGRCLGDQQKQFTSGRECAIVQIAEVAGKEAVPWA